MARVPDAPAELPVNIFRALGHAPEVNRGYMSLGGRLLSKGLLDARTRELVINAISVHLDAPYEWGHHAKPYLDAGGSPDDLEALKSGRLDALDDRGRAAVAYALKVEDRTVSDADVEGLRVAGFADGEIVELTVLAGFYGMTARFLRAMDVQFDDGLIRDFAIPG